MTSLHVNDLVPARVAEEPDDGVDVVTLGDGETLTAISSPTARAILIALGESPSAASEIAQETDRSIQTVAYHLDQLTEVGLVETIATTYSEKGRKMDVYALTTQSFVVELAPDA